MVRVYKGFEKKVLEKFLFCGQFVVLGGHRYGLFPDGDHTMGEGWRGKAGGLRTRSADAYMYILIYIDILYPPPPFSDNICLFRDVARQLRDNCCLFLLMSSLYASTRELLGLLFQAYRSNPNR